MKTKTSELLIPKTHH